MKCKVVRVKRLEFGDVCNINESDFDEKLHELYVEGEDTTTDSEEGNVKTKVPADKDADSEDETVKTKVPVDKDADSEDETVKTKVPTKPKGK